MYIRDNLLFFKSVLGVGYRKLSKLSGVTEKILLNIAHGKSKNPTIETVMKLAQTFEISIDDFIYKDFSGEGGKLLENKTKKQW